MHLSCSRDVKSVRAELTDVTKRVDDLENYVTNVEQSLRELNETTIVNIEQLVTDESHEREKLKAQSSHSPQQPCNQRDTRLKICK